MRRLALAALAALSLATPAAARAGGVFELSAGSGARIDPSPVERIPTNVMLAGGYSFAGIVKLELGVLGNLADVKHSEFDLQLRPMLVLSPPVIPLYARAIGTYSGLVNGPKKFQVGGALGVSFGLFGVGAFLEAGALPSTVEVSTPAGKVEKTWWLGEGRLGVYFD